MAAVGTRVTHIASVLAGSALPAELLALAEWFLALVQLVPAEATERSFARAEW
jgi:hypothetical protein